MTKSKVLLIGFGISLFFLVLFLLGVPLFGFEKIKIEQGNVGIRFSTMGKFKYEVLESGVFIVTPGEDIKTFPTNQQNYVYTKSTDEGSKNDESFNFSLFRGVSCTANISVNYHVDPTKVALIYQKYKFGLPGITSGPLRSSLRNAFNTSATKYQVDSMMEGTGKSQLLQEVTRMVQAEYGPLGIIIDNVQLVSDFGYPLDLRRSIIDKNKSIQDAQKEENNQRMAKATAEKDKITAEGEAAVLIAKAKGESEAAIISAEGHAKAMKLETQALSPIYIEYVKAHNWTGVLPQVVGANASTMIDFRK